MVLPGGTTPRDVHGQRQSRVTGGRMARSAGSVATLSRSKTIRGKSIELLGLAEEITERKQAQVGVA